MALNVVFIGDLVELTVYSRMGKLLKMGESAVQIKNHGIAGISESI